MKIALTALTAFAFFLGISPVSSQTAPALGIREKTPDLRAFTGAKIIVSPELTIDNGTLLIEKGRVLAVGVDLDIPDGARVEDVSGLMILPGFIDVYTDYGLQSKENKSQRPRSPKYEADRAGGSAWNEAIHAEKSWVDSFEPDSSKSAELMRQGFTAVQSARLDGIFRGQSFVALLGDGLPNDLIMKANAMAFASFDKGASQQDYPSSLMGSIALIRQSFLDVDWYVSANAAYAQNPAQTRPEYNSALEALARVKSAKQPMLFASGDDGISLARVQKIADEIGLKFFVVGTGREYSLKGSLADLSRCLILPVDFPEIPEVAKAEMEYDYTLGELRHWEWAPSNPALLHNDGLSFAFTTYGLEKKSDFLSRIRAAVKRGLPHAVALRALTSLPAEMLGLSYQMGSLQPGRLANFVVTDGNPLETDATIFATWVAGKEYVHSGAQSRFLTGKYRCLWPDTSAVLSVTVKANKATGELLWGKRQIKLKEMIVDQNSLFFGLEIDTTLPSGVYRTSVDLVADTLSGYVLSPDGQRSPWRALRATGGGASEELKPEEGDENNWLVEPLISKRTFPNRAWGPEAMPQQESVLVKNATVWTAEVDGIIENCDILVIDGKFASVGPDITGAPGIRVIDAEGRHVTPGLIDEHSHIAISHDVNEGTHAVSAEVRIGDVINPTDIDIYRQLAGGVTCAQLLHGSANPIGGQSAVIKHRWGQSADEMTFQGAGRFIKFALGENVKQVNWGEAYTVRYPQTRMGVESIIRDEFIAAREYTQEWDAYNALSKKERARVVPPRRDLRMEAICDILRGDLAIVCHGYVQSEMLMLMKLAEEFGIRVWNFIHVLEGYKIADELAAHGATATTFSDWWAYKFEVYDAIPYGAAIMVNHGVNTTLNSDNNDLARRLNTEAAKTIQYGELSPEDAIKLITINSAIQLKAEQRIGSIKVGKDADFVIWNDYPLSIYASPDQTWIEGTMYFDRDRDLQMRDEVATERAALIQKAIQAASGRGSDSDSNRKMGAEDAGSSPGLYGQSSKGGAR